MGEYVNSRQVRFDKSYVSCGILEAHHLPAQPASQTLFAIATTLFHKANPRPAAFVLFSDIVPEDGTKSRGQALAEAITNKILIGKLLTSNQVVNPKTGNVIRVWLLELYHDAFRKWYQDELANRIVEDE